MSDIVINDWYFCIWPHFLIRNKVSIITTPFVERTFPRFATCHFAEHIAGAVSTTHDAHKFSRRVLDLLP